MIIGIVNANEESVVTVTLRGDGEQTVSFSAVIDTGFSEYVAAPLALIDRLGVLRQKKIKVALADGQVVEANEFRVDVFGDGEYIPATVQAQEGTPLIGMALLRGYNLSVDAVENGPVRITRLL